MIYKTQTLHRKLKIEQRGNQRLFIKGQTIQCLKDKGQKDRQQSTTHYTESKKDLATSIYSESCLNRILSKPTTCLNQTDFTVLSTEH